MRTLLLFVMLLVVSLSGCRTEAAEPISVKWGGYKYRIANPDEVLWSQSQVAQSGVSTNGPFWDQISSKGKVIHRCAQMRVRGVAGDRTSKNYLVICTKAHVSAEHGAGGLLRPKAAYYKRVDPWGAKATPPMPSAAPRKAPQLVIQVMQPNTDDPTPPYPEGSVVVRMYKTNILGSNRWFVYADHPAGQTWALQTAPKMGDWFTPPSYVDDGTRCYFYSLTNLPAAYFKAVRKR